MTEDVPPADETLADRAYRLIQDDILNGYFAPDEPLRLAVLKARYGLSFSPLREALTRLSGDRLTALSSLRGFRVATVSLDEMWDLIRTRTLIECEALRRAVVLGDDDWEARIVAAFHALSKAIERNESGQQLGPGGFDEALEQRHQRFHQALISACDSPSLLHIASQLYTRTERYRRPTLFGALHGQAGPRGIASEHAGIMAATLERDGEVAVKLLSEHYARTGDMIEISLKSEAQGWKLRQDQAAQV